MSINQNPCSVQSDNQSKLSPLDLIIVPYMSLTIIWEAPFEQIIELIRIHVGSEIFVGTNIDLNCNIMERKMVIYCKVLLSTHTTRAI